MACNKSNLCITLCSHTVLQSPLIMSANYNYMVPYKTSLQCRMQFQSVSYQMVKPSSCCINLLIFAFRFLSFDLPHNSTHKSPNPSTPNFCCCVLQFGLCSYITSGLRPCIIHWILIPASGNNSYFFLDFCLKIC